uniref:Hemimethylated DNA-binding domain-containing protein n=2 Tax=Heterosigma akashiwo TaxID=2829 RepID=A0A6V2UBG0_HETAK
MGVHRLAHGASQPFYHVLVDGATRPGPPQETYVAQENVTLLADPCKQRGAWPVRHPDVGRYFDRCVAAAAAGGDGPSTTASSPPGAREEGGHGCWGSNEEEDEEEEEENLARGGQGGSLDGESAQGMSGGECIQGGGKGASSEEEGGREGSEPLLLSQAAEGCVVYRMGPITSLQYPEDAKAFRAQTTPLVQPW